MELPSHLLLLVHEWKPSGGKLKLCPPERIIPASLECE